MGTVWAVAGVAGGLVRVARAMLAWSWCWLRRAKAGFLWAKASFLAIGALSSRPRTELFLDDAELKSWIVIFLFCGLFVFIAENYVQNIYRSWLKN